MDLKIFSTLPILLLLYLLDCGSAQSPPPRGCESSLESVYFNLCDLNAVWGVVLEAIAAVGIVITLILIVVLLCIIPFIQDKRKKASVAIQWIFLNSTLGIFGLTFAFIIKFDQRTCPTRLFLWGVLFSISFSCLLAHAWRLQRLVRTGEGPSTCKMIGLVLVLTLVQVIIAVEYLVLTTVRLNNVCSYENKDFVMLLIYVMFLMALTFILSTFTFCGHYRKWKKHGAHIFVTMFFSIAIWVVWIVMFVRGNAELNKSPDWDDPTLSIALVANGWVFILFYILPELRHITCPAKKEDDPPENIASSQRNPGLKGVDNQVFFLEESNRGIALNFEDNLHSPSYRGPSPMGRNVYSSPQEFTIPRPHTRPSYHPTPLLQDPYLNYHNRQTTF
ncbi:G-protein coupled receptor family C group 5 member B-like isoform X1 [Scyliorhinus canicula]|uniref:G-protein coupled receptor family C group 5 member B-like isoform X1 n=1 Tax=Scyliorhinus canicula TaxID=7830 RepID=UPI0018F5F75C|nr:G-protein coupled receptor family C group 5 member B-like isoform X1 [Scyliorhinus canicula]